MSDLPSNFPSFDGSTFSQERDGSRLASQLADVRHALSRFEWWTLEDLAFETGHPQASISARIRDLRKPKFGGHTVNRRYRERGLWEYSLVLPKGQLSLGLM